MHFRPLAAAMLAALFSVQACAELGGSRQPPPGSIDEKGPPPLVPLQVKNGLPLVEVRLPPDRRAWFLIDTGMGAATLIDRKLSEQMRLKHDIVRDPSMPDITLSAALDFLEVDGMGRRDLTVYVKELADLPELAQLEVPVEGVLGTGYFRGRCLWFDWGHARFTANEPRERRARQVPVPLRFAARGDLLCPVKVNGVNAEAMVDTGSAHTLITREFAEQHALPIDTRGPPLTIQSSIGPVAVRETELEVLGLSTLEIPKVHVFVVERSLPSPILLGNDMLSRFGVILDLGDPPYLVLDPTEGMALPASLVK